MRSSAFLVFALASLGDGARINFHSQAGVDSSKDDVTKWGRLCPPGLEANATANTCSYVGEMFDDPDKGLIVAWAGGSKHPLVFTPWGGLEDAEGELVQELQFMVTQPEFVHHMVASMRHLPQHHSVLSNIHGLVGSLEEDAENLAAVEFVAEHAVEHLVLEGLVFGLNAIAQAAAHGGLGVAAFALEGSVVGLEVVGSILASPVVLGASAVHTAYQLRRHFATKDARSREFSVALVAKADCIISKVELHHESIFTIENGHGVDPTFFRQEFEDVCGTDIEVQLADQMVKTNLAMVNLFNEFKGVGKCLFPEGPRSWSKSNCVAAIYEPLREEDGEPGILYSAFALAAAYAKESDEVLRKPVYAQWFEQYFNISMPHSESVIEDLIRVRDGGESIQERATICISIMGMHRAFERVFIRLKTALDVYMHTFARERVHWSTRTTQHPCRRIFRKMEDRQLGLCKEGLDLPLVSPDSEWLMEHAEHLSSTSLDDVGSCIEDSHPDLALSIFNSGPEEGENEEEEEHGGEEEADEEE